MKLRVAFDGYGVDAASLRLVVGPMAAGKIEKAQWSRKLPIAQWLPMVCEHVGSSESGCVIQF